MPSRCSCGWPLDYEGECSACRVRKIDKLPAHARCETCVRWRVTMRCLNFGPHAVCRSWHIKPTINLTNN
jgi:hypothetical protein